MGNMQAAGGALFGVIRVGTESDPPGEGFAQRTEEELQRGGRGSVPGILRFFCGLTTGTYRWNPSGILFFGDGFRWYRPGRSPPPEYVPHKPDPGQGSHRSGTPPGCGDLGREFRWCRALRALNHRLGFWQASGLQKVFQPEKGSGSGRSPTLQGKGSAQRTKEGLQRGCRGFGSGNSSVFCGPIPEGWKNPSRW